MRFIESSITGLQAYPEGLRWLLRHPFYLILLIIPFILSVGGLFYAWDALRYFDAWLTANLLFPQPESWWLWLVWSTCQWMLFLAVRILAIVIAMLIANALWAPIYEWVSCAVEKDFTKGALIEVSLWRSFLLIGEEIKKVVFILLISLVCMFVPGLNILSFFITAFLLGWNFFDLPLARRGWSFRKRLGFVWKNKWTVGGFGLWLMIPFVQILLFPFAVVGGTLISLRALQQHQLLHVRVI